MSECGLSALVVAHNEEDRIADCLDRLAFADEIVVVLDDCSDGTKTIAARYTGRLVEGSWEFEGDRAAGRLGYNLVSGRLRHRCILIKFHRIDRPPLRHRPKFSRVTEHFAQWHNGLYHLCVGALGETFNLTTPTA